MKVLLIWFLLAGLNPNQSAQKTRIDPNQFNHRYLEQLIEIEINKYRRSRYLPFLRIDRHCFLAAHDHSKFLNSSNIYSHRQVDRRKTYPQDRLKFYGGEFVSIGENISYVYWNKSFHHRFENKRYASHKIDTYEDAAYHLVLSWIKSPSHHEAIINEDYVYTGVAVAFDPWKKKIYAVQVFGGKE